MRTFTLNLYRRIYYHYMWKKVASKTHAQRRYEQLRSLIENTTDVDKLYQHAELVEEYEERFGDAYFGDRYVASLGAVIAKQERELYRRQIHY